MLRLRSFPMELRGIVNKVSEKGKVYYIVNAEDSDGTAHQFYAPSSDFFEEGLAKGDYVLITFLVRYFKGKEQLEVKDIEKWPNEKTPVGC